MKVYLAVPLTHKRNIKNAQHICNYLIEQNNEITSLWVAKDKPKEDLNTKEILTPEQVFKRDIETVTLSDALIAEVSQPSFGIGMEIMAAVKAKIPVACLYENSKKISFLVLGVPGIYAVPYTVRRIDEGLNKILMWLQSINSKFDHE